MAQTSRCNNCGSRVTAHDTYEDRAYFSCSCGNKWSGRAFYGNTGSVGTGAIIGGALGMIFGGPLGGVIGAGLGAASGAPDTCSCLACGGTGYSTGRRGKTVMYQCRNCKKTWTRRKH